MSGGSTGSGFDFAAAVSAVFQGEWAPPDGARLEGLKMRFGDGGAVQLEAGIMHIPSGARFIGVDFPRGGKVTFKGGQAEISHNA